MIQSFNPGEFKETPYFDPRKNYTKKLYQELYKLSTYVFDPRRKTVFRMTLSVKIVSQIFFDWNFSEEEKNDKFNHRPKNVLKSHRRTELMSHNDSFLWWVPKIITNHQFIYGCVSHKMNSTNTCRLSLSQATVTPNWTVTQC